MRKIIFVLIFLLLILVHPNKVWATECTCTGTGVECAPAIPSECGTGEICNCGADGYITDFNSGAIGCRTGKSICISASSPTTSPWSSIAGTPTIDIHGPCPTDKITTALGCVPTGNFSDFVGWLLKRLIGISGGIAFLLVIFGGFKILTSAGNPKGIQAGGEMISSALIGLLFIIFSIFLLELIGVKILGIPGL